MEPKFVAHVNQIRFRLFRKHLRPETTTTTTTTTTAMMMTRGVLNTCSVRGVPVRSKRTSVAPRAEAKDASSSDLPVPPKADGEDFKAKFQQWQDTSSASNREAKPFTVAEGQMGKLAGASLPTVLTALAGAFAPGYKGSLKKKQRTHSCFRSRIFSWR